MTLPLRSLGLATDRLVMAGQEEVELHADRIVIRTPAQPDYWFGNALIIRDGRVDPDAQIARFRADLPTMSHVALMWDTPAPERVEAFSGYGMELNRDDVLTLSGVPEGPDPPSGFAIRTLESDVDWEQLVDLQQVIGVEDGHDPESHFPYLSARYRQIRTRIVEGRGAWFGAFHDGRLVATSGVFHDDRLGRYQDVATDPQFRRRGLCAALVRHAGAWVRDRAPGAALVIVADAEGRAGRVYRRCGFAHVETLVSVLRRPG